LLPQLLASSTSLLRIPPDDRLTEDRSAPEVLLEDIWRRRVRGKWVELVITAKDISRRISTPRIREGNY
jgi:hypothetical protein